MNSNMVCPECRENVYSTWDYCPNCGAELNIRERILDAIRELDADPSKRVSKVAFNENTPFTDGTAGRLFGSWNDAVAAAGIEPVEPPAGADAALSAGAAEAKLLDLKERLGEAPSRSEAQERLDVAAVTILSALGVSTWHEALMKCGIYSCKQCDFWTESSQSLAGHVSTVHG